jgi:hypothetical protein
MSECWLSFDCVSKIMMWISLEQDRQFLVTSLGRLRIVELCFSSHGLLMVS